jgi:guanylate kinase
MLVLSSPSGAGKTTLSRQLLVDGLSEFVRRLQAER